jgi:hypothetical protein
VVEELWREIREAIAAVDAPDAFLIQWVSFPWPAYAPGRFLAYRGVPVPYRHGPV